MAARSGELLAKDEPAIVTKSLLDAIVVKNGQCDRCFPDTSRTNESDGCEVLNEANDLLNQLAASEEGPWQWRR